MRIIIVGCGKVGAGLAGQLSAEGHELTLIDVSAQRLDELSAKLDVATVTGNGTRYQTLKEAGIRESDLLIAVTTDDEINLLACLIARQASNQCHTIARVRDPEYMADRGFIRDELGISMLINPELSTAHVVSRLIRFPSAIGVSTFTRGRTELLTIRIPPDSRLDGMAVCEVDPLLHTEALLCMVRRGEQTYIPKGDFILRAGDDITVIVPPNEQTRFFQQVGMKNDRIASAMLVGGGKIAYFLGKILLSSGISVKIIESQRDRCELLSELLPAATIIHGDGTDRDLLDEEGLATCEAFAALTNMDEENILLSLHAGRHSKARLFTKVNRSNFEEVIESLPIGTVVRPRQTTAELIGQYTRAMQNSMGSNVETLHRLNDDAEALEFRVAAHHLTGVPLQDMPIRPDVLLCCINRRGRRIIPRGRDELHVGDTVIVVSTHKGMNDLQDIIRPEEEWQS
ncbi:MAG: Trk system potassium transporter TrkA [Eubacteriales bacterium]|nr:Trk system potassium transporter TrkA [Eubacteriales bacterium]